MIRRIIRLSKLARKSNRKNELAIALVDLATITSLNETYLSHQGPTDVITFDYRNDECDEVGEICVSVDVAAACAEARSLGDEVVLYIVHGVLHLAGFDDHTPADRRLMHQRQNLIMHELRSDFELAEIFRS